MSVPTIISVTPSRIWSGGQWVRIIGTGFRLPSEPGPSTAPLPEPSPTVRVVFGVDVATNVRVFSATELECTAPVHDAGALSVTVTNLDDDGVPIVGETVVAANAVTYARPALTDTADLTRVTEAVVRELARQVLANVVVTTSVDYATEGAFEMTELAKLPALVVSGPRCEEDRLYDPVLFEEADGDKVRSYRAWTTYDLHYQITALANKTKPLNNLIAILTRWVSQNELLRVSREEGGTAYVEYETTKDSDPQVLSTPNNSDLRAAQIGFVVCGVQVQDLPGLSGSSVRDSDYPVEETTVTVGV